MEKERRKLTYSCSRCRIAKLKCDRGEPCRQCVKRDLGHLCCKDERVARRKRRLEDERIVDDDQPVGRHVVDANNESVMDAMESFVHEEGLAKETVTVVNLSSHQLQSLAMSGPAPDLDNPYWYRVALTDVSARQTERQQLVAEVAETMPDAALIRTLSEIFVTRCQAPLGNVVHTPSHMHLVEKLCACVDASHAGERYGLLFHSFKMDMLAYLLLSLSLGLAFHPSPTLVRWHPTPQALRIEEERSKRPSKSAHWRSLALRCLRGTVTPFTRSIASLQACIMLLLDGQQDSQMLDSVLVEAISGARGLGLHHLGDAVLHASIDGENGCTSSATCIRTEVGVRIWWALSARDWAQSHHSGYYSIHPSQVTTRKPLHINDGDLCLNSMRADGSGRIIDRSKTEYTMMSYTIQAIKVCELARALTDLRSSTVDAVTLDKRKSQLGSEYESLFDSLPPYFRPGSMAGIGATAGPAQGIPVHRWMLHQQLWTLLLRLYRGSLLDCNGSQSGHLLAQNVIGSQAQLQSLCVVCGSLSTNQTQLFCAAAVLVFGLVQRTCATGDRSSNDDLVRLMTREKVREAIELLRSLPDHRQVTDTDLASGSGGGASLRAIKLLEGMMDLEANSVADRGEQRGGGDIAGKVMVLITSLHDQTRKAMESLNLPQTVPETVAAEEVLKDLDVLPITLAEWNVGRSPLDHQICPTHEAAPASFLDTSLDLDVFLDMVANSLLSTSPTSTGTTFDTTVYTPSNASGPLTGDLGLLQGGSNVTSVSPASHHPQHTMFRDDRSYQTVGAPTPPFDASKTCLSATRARIHDAW